jgi:hypothetical protein
VLLSRKRCGAAKTVHGFETRSIRKERRQKLAELKFLERLAKGAGIIGR